jgi:YVTN family beta-propeller protein
MNDLSSGLSMLLAGVTAVFGQSAANGDPASLSYYVGAGACKPCHESCATEPIPTHRDAFDTLSKTAARSIARISGVGETPSNSLFCQSCHAAGADLGPRWWRDSFRIEDGVQCESCHGAGSLHIDHRNTPPAMNGTGGADPIIRSDREFCGTCHFDRPSHRAVLREGFTLDTADRRYKTPVNMAVTRDGLWLYVVCEHSDSLIVVNTEKRTVTKELSVGRRPQDVTIDEATGRIFVTNRMAATVSVVDPVSLTVVKELPVGAEPHGVAVDTRRRRLYVLSTADNWVSVIDADTLAPIKRIVAGSGPWSIAVDEGRGRAHVSSVRPQPASFRDPPTSEVTVIDLVRGIAVARPVAEEANMLQGVAIEPRTGAALVTLMRCKNLIPASRLAQGWGITNGLAVVWPDGRLDQVLLDAPYFAYPDLMDIAISPDGKRALVVVGGADEAVVLEVPTLLNAITSATDRERADILPNHLGMSNRFIVKRVTVGANPRSVVYAPSGALAYVANALEDTISVIETGGYSVVATISLGGPSEVTRLRHGERLFHNASITAGRQFSCRSCHPDGHINGLTFDIEADGAGMNPVDNRTLRGIIDTRPFKWEGTNPTLHRQCGPRLAVFFTRLAPYTPDDLDALVRYICTIERPPNRYRDPSGLSLSQRRGKTIFERTARNNGMPIPKAKQCSSCHSGAHHTNRERVAVSTTMWFDAPVDVDLRSLFDTNEFGELGAYYFVDAGLHPKILDVPHLRNIVDSPPFLHNGAASTLEEIWTRFNMTDRHGSTADLTREQLNDLISYLKSL